MSRPEGVDEGAAAARERILEALAESCAEKGYAATTTNDIASRAGVSKRTLYKHFADKQACLEAAIARFLASAAAAVASVDSAGAEPAQRFREAAAGLLEAIARDRAFAEVAFLESVAARPGDQDGYSGGEMALLCLFGLARELAPDDAQIPERASRAALGGAHALIADQLVAGRADQLPELLPELVYIVLMPYVGQPEAARQSRLAAGSEAR